MLHRYRELAQDKFLTQSVTRIILTYFWFNSRIVLKYIFFVLVIIDSYFGLRVQSLYLPADLAATGIQKGGKIFTVSIKINEAPRMLQRYCIY